MSSHAPASPSTPASSTQKVSARPRTPGEPTHRQIVTSRGVLVDERMRPLLEALWSCGLDTDFSCQGDPADWDHPLSCTQVGRRRNTHIIFTRYADALEFLRACEPVLTRPVPTGSRFAAAFGCRPAGGRPPRPALKAAVDFPLDVLDEITALWVARAEELSPQS